MGLLARASQLSAPAAHATLEDAPSTGTVTSIALAWGGHSLDQPAGIGLSRR